MRNPVPFSSHLLWPVVRVLLGILILAGVTAIPRAALAKGTVRIADLAPKEDDRGRWKLKMSIHYGETPHLSQIPMIFSFTPTMLYERTLTDQSGDKPVLNKIPLANQQGIHESMEVGFMDAGTGKIYPETKFDFVIRRDRGFEAGEYTLVIKAGGTTIGQPQKLRLQGDNPVVDRRAIVFSGEKKKTEKKEEGGDAKAEEEKKEEAKKEEPALEKVGDPSGESAAETPTEAPPETPPKQGGCGCRLAGSDSRDGAVGALGAAGLWIAPFALALIRRRRRA